VSNQIPLIDLAAQQERIRDRIDAAVARVLDHGKYILGPEVQELEEKLAEFTGAKHVVTCANGTDALSLVLMAEGVGPGDAVFAPSFTFVATAEIVPGTGATPVLVDVDSHTFNIDPASLEAGIEKAKALGLRPRMIVAVDLFGLPANYPALRKIADREGMTLIADAAQSFGADIDGRRTGVHADYTTTSFFPAKPLGCYGDGGAIMTADDEKADLLRSLRFHGKGEDKYDNVRIGLNSRLDTLQAAILLEKLAIFEDEIAARHDVALAYINALSEHVICQKVPETYKSVWAQFTIVVDNRSHIEATCREAGIATAIYYPLPMHMQSGYKSFPIAGGGLPVSEWLAQHVISIPMYPGLRKAQIDHITKTVLDALSV
jgi:dTDP-4-amino-4,6-dideoxygalactose transaminase|tara:strand:- start:14329 stop:15456 length:1128 start_codon:yes stop_codon:yes gene_type:complete